MAVTQGRSSPGPFFNPCLFPLRRKRSARVRKVFCCASCRPDNPPGRQICSTRPSNGDNRAILSAFESKRALFHQPRAIFAAGRRKSIVELRLWTRRPELPSILHACSFVAIMNKGTGTVVWIWTCSLLTVGVGSGGFPAPLKTHACLGTF